MTGGLRNYKVVDEKFPTEKPRRPVEPNFKGPMEKRECTDVYCCLLFSIILAAWVVLLGLSVALGQPERLLRPTDSKGRLCGVKTDQYDLRNRSHLYFFDLSVCTSYASVIQGCLTPQVCVSKCPDDFYTLATHYLKGSGGFDKVKPFCAEDFIIGANITLQEMQLAVDSGICPGYYVPQRPVLHRCVPKILADISDAAERRVHKSLVDITDANYNQTVNDSSLPDSSKMPSAKTIISSRNFVQLAVVAKEVGERIFADFQRIWRQMAVAVCFTVAVSFLWIVLMKWVAAVMIWLSVTLLLLGLVLFTSLCWYWWYQLQFAGGNSPLPIPKQSHPVMYFTEFWLGVAVVLSVLVVLFIILLIFLWKRILLAVALLRESSRVLKHITSALLFPLFPFVCHLLIFFLWGFIAVQLASMGRPHCQVFTGASAIHNSSASTNRPECSCDLASNISSPLHSTSNNNITDVCKFTAYRRDPTLIAAQVFNVFLLFWASLFVSALSQVTLAGAVASYYYAYNKPDDIPSLPLLKAFVRAVRYHLGSMALGSLVLSIVKIVRVVLEFLEERMKNHNENPVVKCLICCCSCFTWCLEGFLKFLTQNAYIMVAIYGKNFCWSAREAFDLIARNAARVVVLDGVTDFLLFIGKLLIVTGNGILWGCYFGGYFGGFTTQLVRDLNYFYVPVVVIVVISFAVTSAFFGVYEQAVDTTFLCFLEDCERNDGTPERPYFMSKNLMKILSK